VDCKEAQILSIPHLTGELELGSEQCRELEAHLRCCPACREKCDSSKWVLEFIERHKAQFAEVLESVERGVLAEQEELLHSWQDINAKLDKIEARGRQEKRILALGTPWKVAAAAACLIIGVSICLMLSDSRPPERLVSQQESLPLAASVRIELLSEGGRISLPASEEISTSADELKTLIINGQHRLMMNANSALLVEPLEQDARLGCMVRLSSGEIFARVEHDGNPFIVNTPQGRAVITGTIFDVKATDTRTTLVVSEGTVRFESENGLVRVKSGQISQIAAQSAPTEPAPCNATELTAWARSHEIETALAKIKPFSDAYDLTDLWLSASSGQIDLEAIDYDDWVEKKRDWFEREFPWVFEFQRALAKEGTDVDYPELLLKSGQILRFAYPAASPRQLCAVGVDWLPELADAYGRDRQWLLTNVPASGSAITGSASAKKQVFGLEAFEKWADQIKDGRQSLNGLAPDTLLYSLHAGVYLANTRTLAVLWIKNGSLEFRDQEKAELLTLLEAQVNTANELTGQIIMLFATSSDWSCDDSQVILSGIAKDIGVIKSIEERVVQYDH
jgi:hypothetical protein